jgi:peptide/nickel transport system substrate-binding protein
VLLAAGCSDETDSAAIDSGTVPGAGGVLVWALPEGPAALDPLYAASPNDLLVSRQVHEPLVAVLSGPFDDTRQLNGLALSALPSSDASVWRLRLRPGVRFHDGAPFNASAVLANVERWRASAPGRALLGDTLVDAPRPDLVRFILAAPDPGFGRVLASPRLGLVSPRTLDHAGGGALSADQAAQSGTGPYELRERSRDRLLLARNTDWWGTDRNLGPAIDQLEFEVVADPGERLARLDDGSVQVASALTPAELAQVRANPLLAVVAQPGDTAIGVERSVRGIPAGVPAPPLNGVWRTAVVGAQ